MMPVISTGIDKVKHEATVILMPCIANKFVIVFLEDVDYAELFAMQEAVKDESAAEKMSPVALGKMLGYLQHQLTDLHLEKLLGPEASIDLSDPQGALRQ